MSESLLIKTRNALIQAGKSPQKALSQNFLICEDILDKQIEWFGAQLEDARKRGDFVIIAGHIPLGRSLYREDPEEYYDPQKKK